MRNFHRFLQSLLSVISLGAILAITSNSPADEVKPPKGFSALFNGKDLNGWHGMPHFDPYKLAAMSDDERKALTVKWTEDSKKHWTVDKDELVNDGNGAYQLLTK